MADPASSLAGSLGNRLLDDEAWARERLRVHAGQAFSFTSGPVSTAYRLRDDGTLEGWSAKDGPISLELHVSPLDLPALAAEPERWDALVTAKGDAALAHTLRELSTTLPWFVERAFARAFGPVLGQRLADAGRRLLGWPDYVNHRLVQNVASYARDEAGLLAAGDAMRALVADTAALASRVDRLASRIASLAGR